MTEFDDFVDGVTDGLQVCAKCFSVMSVHMVELLVYSDTLSDEAPDEIKRTRFQPAENLFQKKQSAQLVADDGVLVIESARLECGCCASVSYSDIRKILDLKIELSSEDEAQRRERIKEVAEKGFELLQVKKDSDTLQKLLCLSEYEKSYAESVYDESLFDTEEFINDFSDAISGAVPSNTNTETGEVSVLVSSPTGPITMVFNGAGELVRVRPTNISDDGGTAVQGGTAAAITMMTQAMPDGDACLYAGTSDPVRTFFQLPDGFVICGSASFYQLESQARGEIQVVLTIKKDMLQAQELSKQLGRPVKFMFMAPRELSQLNCKHKLPDGSVYQIDPSAMGINYTIGFPKVFTEEHALQEFHKSKSSFSGQFASQIQPVTSWQMSGSPVNNSKELSRKYQWNSGAAYIMFQRVENKAVGHYIDQMFSAPNHIAKSAHLVTAQDMNGNACEQLLILGLHGTGQLDVSSLREFLRVNT